MVILSIAVDGHFHAEHTGTRGPLYIIESEVLCSLTKLRLNIFVS